MATKTKRTAKGKSIKALNVAKSDSNKVKGGFAGAPVE